jgi:hypothetical protein
MLSWGQLSVALPQNDRVSMGGATSAYSGAVNSSIFQCKQWSVRHSIRAAASNLFWRKFREVSLFTAFNELPRPCLAQSPLRLGIIHGPMIDRSLS